MLEIGEAPVRFRLFFGVPGDFKQAASLNSFRDVQADYIQNGREDIHVLGQASDPLRAELIVGGKFDDQGNVENFCV